MAFKAEATLESPGMFLKIPDAQVTAWTEPPGSLGVGLVPGSQQLAKANSAHVFLTLSSDIHGNHLKLATVGIFTPQT